MNNARIKPLRAGLIIWSLIIASFGSQSWTSASAQTLARPGWAGSGLRSDPWWKHAVIYDVADADPLADPDELNSRLNSLRALGVDAIIIPAPTIELDPGKLTDSSADTVGPEWMDSFEELVHQAGADGLRILVRLRVPNVDSAVGTVRMWLSHGAAGLYLLPNPGSSDNSVGVESVRKLVAAAPGNRLVLTSINPVDAPKQTVRSAGNLLYVHTSTAALNPANTAILRTTIQSSLQNPNQVLSLRPAGSDVPSLREVVAAVALTLRPTSLIPSELASQTQAHGAASSDGGDNFADWIKELTTLDHSNPTLRYGRPTILDFDPEHALVWVVEPPSGMRGNAPLVIACNLSSDPVQLPLTAAIRRLHFNARFLRPLLRSSEAAGTQELNALQLPGYGVYVGELRR